MAIGYEDYMANVVDSINRGNVTTTRLTVTEGTGDFIINGNYFAAPPTARQRPNLDQSSGSVLTMELTFPTLREGVDWLLALSIRIVDKFVAVSVGFEPTALLHALR
jgi:hypothetical protein